MAYPGKARRGQTLRCNDAKNRNLRHVGLLESIPHVEEAMGGCLATADRMKQLGINPYPYCYIRAIPR